MKKNDRVICTHGAGYIEEVFDNGTIHFKSDYGDDYRMYLEECMLIEEYHDLPEFKLETFFKWFFSPKFDRFLQHYFFLFLKYFFIFCMAATVSMAVWWVLIKISVIL